MYQYEVRHVFSVFYVLGIAGLVLPQLQQVVPLPEALFLSITVYDNQKKEGLSMTMDVVGCQNLPGDWNDRASSLDVHGTCLKLYKDADCTGRLLTVVPENRGWLDNLKIMGFNDMLSSVSTCRPESPKLQSGRFAIQSPMDRKVLTVRRLIGGYTMLKTERWRKEFSQQWDAEKNDDGTFWLTPRVFENNRLTYNLKSPEDAPTERINWIIEGKGLSNRMYTVRKDRTKQCLTMRGRMETQLNECRQEDRRQHWIFHKVRGGSEEE